MADRGLNLKNMVIKGMEAIGNTATSIANSTRQKMDALSLQGEKEELLTKIGEQVVELWKAGENLPGELTENVEKAILIDEQMKVVQREQSAEETSGEAEETPAPVLQQEMPQEAPAVRGAQAVEYTAQDDHDIPVIEVEREEGKATEEEPCPLSSAINDLFEKMPPVDKMAEKVNSSLDELGENLRKFSGEFDKELNRFADQMMGKDGDRED
ncbi:MAG: hypothetical protein IKQ45_02130 [Clostridia bacterium]|nr:hypothetical protein [Clostridia bacterium]